MSKPKVYGFCKAGCKWETVHKDDFLASASIMAAPKNENSSSWHLEKGKQYKITGTQAKTNTSGDEVWSWAFQLHCWSTLKISASQTIEKPVPITLPSCDKYSEGFTFKWLDTTISVGTSGATVAAIYEMNGTRRQSTAIFAEYTDPGTTIADSYMSLVDVTTGEDLTNCYIYNEDAQIIAKDGKSVYVAYSTNADGTDYTETWSAGQNYIGVATSDDKPTQASDYTWSEFIDGDTSAMVKQTGLLNIQIASELPPDADARTDTIYIHNGTAKYFVQPTITLCPLGDISGTGPAVSIAWVKGTKPAKNATIYYATDMTTTNPQSITELSAFDTVGTYTASTKLVNAKTFTDWQGTWTGSTVTVKDVATWNTVGSDTDLTPFYASNLEKQAYEALINTKVTPQTLSYGYSDLYINYGAEQVSSLSFGSNGYITFGNFFAGKGGPISSGGTAGFYNSGEGITFSNERLADVGTPTQESDAATKSYVDEKFGSAVSFSSGAALVSTDGTITGTALDYDASGGGSFALANLSGTFTVGSSGSTEIAGGWIALKGLSRMVLVQKVGAATVAYATMTVNSTGDKLTFSGLPSTFNGANVQFAANIVKLG